MNSEVLVRVDARLKTLAGRLSLPLFRTNHCCRFA